jgi:hypothetical protein
MGRYLNVNGDEVCSKYCSKIIAGTLEFVDKFYFKKHTKHLVCMNMSKKLDSMVYTIVSIHSQKFIDTLDEIVNNDKFKIELLKYIDETYFNGRELKRLLNDKIASFEWSIEAWIYYNVYDNEVYKAYWN